jgi:hypothetical protein
MIAAAIIAAGVLAPAGVTAGIQADPVCLQVTAQPGHSYPLTVYVSGNGPLTLAVRDTGGLYARLHKVPADWVKFAANPVSPGDAALTLAVPADAASGAYWSDIEAGTQGQAQPGSGGQAVMGAAAATAIVFTVGPSSTPPPPCDALDLAQSTGKFPPWPTKAFATSSWAQVFAREGHPRPDGPPTASPGPSGSGAQPAAAEPVAVSPASDSSPASSSGAIWWMLLAAAAVWMLCRFRRRS